MNKVFESHECPNMEHCNFTFLVKHEELKRMLYFVFCKANYEKCTRYQRKLKEGKVPEDLWPLEMVSTSEVLKNLDIDIKKEIEQCHNLYKEFRESCEFKKALMDVFSSLKKKLTNYYVNFIFFFRKYYNEIFLNNNSLEFFIEIAYEYVKKGVDDSLFDSSFFLFVAKLEEEFLNFLKYVLKTEEYTKPLMSFQKINTLALMFIKKNIKLIEELKLLYESRKTLLEIKDELYIDPLTKVYNRKFLNTFLNNILDGYNFMLILDIDYFKKINDTYGHDVGDMALKELCKILKKELRQNDIIIRYGGEEFLIFLQIPEDDINIAKKVAERLRKAIEKHSFKAKNKEIKFTVSMGLTKINTSLSFEDIFKQADEALYKAKKAGRNRVIAFEEIKKEENTIKD